MLVIGAKGFAKELLEILIQNDCKEEIVFYDDVSNDLPHLLFGKYRVIKDIDRAKLYIGSSNRFALGIGSPSARFKLWGDFTKFGGKSATVISKLAHIGYHNNLIQEGVNILTNVVIESNNIIGRGCLIHVGAFISHDIKIGEFCEISPFVKILGGVSIGDFCSIGTGAIILPKIRLGNNVIVGAGAVVTKDFSDNTTVVGIPARPLLK